MYIDPEAELLYNDCNMHNPGKAEFAAEFVRSFYNRVFRFMEVDMQSHAEPLPTSIMELDTSILTFSEAGVSVHINEPAVGVLPQKDQSTTAGISTTGYEYEDEMNPWPDGLPEEVKALPTERYGSPFRLCLKHRDQIDRVTTGDTSDDASWKTNFPIPGRTNHPLRFDRNRQHQRRHHAVAALKQQRP
jgi:endo-1,4-beta-xylanase